MPTTKLDMFLCSQKFLGNALFLIMFLPIEAGTKRMQRYRRHFRSYNLSCTNWNFTEVCSKVFNKKTNVNSDTVWAPNRWKAIIWTNAGFVDWCICASRGLRESNRWLMLQATRCAPICIFTELLWGRETTRRCFLFWWRGRMTSAYPGHWLPM